MTPEIKLVIFDCDGVLVDSELLSASMVVEVFGEIGLNVDLPFVYKNFVGHAFTSVAANYAMTHGKNVPSDFVDSYRNRLLESFDRHLKPMAGIKVVLDQLNVPVCVATGASELRASRSLEVAGLTSYFQNNVYSSSMVPRGKPAPDVFLLAASSMGVHPENCLVIEDSTAGVEGGKAAGMTTWQFKGGVHFNHGYQHVRPPHLVDRIFDRMESFFEAAPQLQRR